MPPHCREICNATALRTHLQLNLSSRLAPKDRFFACFPRRQFRNIGQASRYHNAVAAEPHQTAVSIEKNQEQDEKAGLSQARWPTDPATAPARKSPFTRTPKVRYVTGHEWELCPKRKHKNRNVRLSGNNSGGKGSKTQHRASTDQLPKRSSDNHPPNTRANFFTSAEREILEKIAAQVTPVDQDVLAKIEKRRRHVSNTEQFLSRGRLAFDWRIPLKALVLHTGRPGHAAGWQQADNEEERDEDSALLRRVQQGLTRYQSKHVDQIPEPAHWSSQSVTQYIYDLVQSCVPPAHMGLLYGPGVSHQVAVKDKLMALLQDSEVKLHLNRTAYHLVMRFLQRSSMIDSSRRLPYAMAELDIFPTRETFNILLSHSAKVNDLFALTVGIQLMLKCKITPDAWTWQCLLVCVESPTVKCLIRDYMISMGFIEQVSIARGVATNLVRSAFVRNVQVGGHLRELIDEYDQTYGRHWLGVHAANVIVHEAGLLGRVNLALDMLQIMVDRGCQPNASTLQALLKGLRVTSALTREIAGAINIVRLFSRKFNIEPDSSCYDVLFSIGFDSCKANFCRAVWQHACLNGKVTSTMDVRVVKALTKVASNSELEGSDNSTSSNSSVEVLLSPSVQSDRASFLAGSSKIIAGVGTALKDERQKSIWEDYRAALESGDRGNRLTKAARAMRNADRTSSQRLAYAGSWSFADLLQIANKIDDVWRERAKEQATLAKRGKKARKQFDGSNSGNVDEQQMVEQLNLDWMLRWAVRVDVVHRRKTAWRRIRPDSGDGVTPPLRRQRPSEQKPTATGKAAE